MGRNKRISNIFWMTIIIFIISVTQLYALEKNVPFPKYGTGPVQVTIYSNYSCPPCREMEPMVEPILHDLLKRDAITLTLVDVPFSEGCVLCAKYFLYAMKKNNDVAHAFHVKNIIYNKTAGKQMTTEADFQNLFKTNGISFEVFDASPILKRYNILIKQDKIASTPTCVIIKDGKKKQHSGGPDIINALKGLK